MKKNIQPNWFQLTGSLISSFAMGWLWYLGAESLVIGIIIFGILATNIKLNNI
jgi:hypothetical protein